MCLSVGESLLSCLIGIDGDVALEDETERTVIGHIVPDPVEEDDDLIAHGEDGAQVYDEP